MFNVCRMVYSVYTSYTLWPTHYTVYSVLYNVQCTLYIITYSNVSSSMLKVKLCIIWYEISTKSDEGNDSAF